MRAIVCRKLVDPTRNAGFESLGVVQDWSVAPCGAKDVRISVISAGLNFADLLIVQGLYQERPKLPFVPGAEVFGVVTEVGSKVKSFKKADKVVAVCFLGGVAEECVVNEGSVFKVHGNGDPSLGGFPIAYGTAHVSLVHRAQLKAGEKVLISGAAGGLGLAGLQIAKLLGAEVIAIARGKDKVQALRQAGADIIIDSNEHPDVKSLAAAIKKTTNGGVDVIFDVVGGTVFDAAMRSVRWGGRVLVLGFASGKIPKLAANILLVKNLAIHGVYWGAYLQNDLQVLRDSMTELLSWWAQGKLRVNVSHKFPLGRFDEALKTLAQRNAVGKILITNETQARL
ncbi:hypothetical protein BSKO_07495 [Bryopsis sp. KO-2023]|nr:hypothetical protein BSKO_07495 [Bryopsis sp. KO-2023]